MTNYSEHQPRKKFTKKLGYEEAKLKAASFCAYQERYQQEVRDRLYSYGLIPEEVEDLLSYLISEGFVNEERFAKAFAGGRFRIKKWGKTRIEKELQQRRISPYCIRKGLEEIEDSEYRETLEMIIDKKADTLTGYGSFELKQRIARYVLGKGFESGLVWDILNDKF